MTVKDSIRKRSKNNILLNLDAKKPYYGITDAYCQWYLSDPSREKNVALTLLYDQMNSVEATHHLTKVTIKSVKKQGQDIFDKNRDTIEKALIPESMRAQVTPAQVKRSRGIGLIVGIIIALVVMYILIKRYLP